MLRVVVKSEADKRRAIAAVNAIDLDAGLEVSIKKHAPNRTLDQNRLLHAIFRDVSEQYAAHHGRWYSPDVWKIYFKDRYLGSDGVLLPDGTVTDVTRSTARLSRRDFSVFLEQIFMECATDHGIVIETRDYG